MIGNSSQKGSGCGCGGGAMVSVAPCGCGTASCASCQGQGIVRPRFFAGQLLTEDDLQLLTDYAGQKNRLHNRHLFGAGVVCGLDVTCHPCGDGRVIVDPGYALDCCGNDLTLACAQTLDINEMVRDLRRSQLGGFDCEEPCPDPRADVDCTEQTNQEETDDKQQTSNSGQAKLPRFRYCLYIRYCEQSSDPVMPYSTGDDCGRLACEATRVREGVKFELRCSPLPDAANPLIQRLCACLGDLKKLQQIGKSLKQLQAHNEIAHSTLRVNGEGFNANSAAKELPLAVKKLGDTLSTISAADKRETAPGTSEKMNRLLVKDEISRDEVSQLAVLINQFRALPIEQQREFLAKERGEGSTFSDNISAGERQLGQVIGLTAASSVAAVDEVRNWLLERLNNSPFLTDCTLRQRVYKLIPPSFGAGKGDYEDRARLLIATLDSLMEAAIDYLRDCVCRALNPPCVPCEDSAVLLACLDVEKCKVIKVCNLERTFVLSPAAVRYWLPPLQLIGNLAERLCCAPLQLLLNEDPTNDPNNDHKGFDPGAFLLEEIVRMLRDSLCDVKDEMVDEVTRALSGMLQSGEKRLRPANKAFAAAPRPATSKKEAEVAEKDRAAFTSVKKEVTQPSGSTRKVGLPATAKKKADAAKPLNGKNGKDAAANKPAETKPLETSATGSPKTESPKVDSPKGDSPGTSGKKGDEK